MRQRLIVEGQNDIRVISQFWMCCNLVTLKEYENFSEKEREWRFRKEFVTVAGGKDELKEAVRALLMSNLSEIDCIGIIMDADENPSAKWQAIKQILENRGYINLPANLPLEGLVAEQADLPKIGLWIMPNNISKGYLEHFYEHLIRVDDELKPVVTNTIQSLSDQKIIRFPPVRTQKAFVHTWLSWQENPGASMGLAMQEKPDLFDFQQPTAQAFLAWSRQIFQFTEQASS